MSDYEIVPDSLRLRDIHRGHKTNPMVFDLMDGKTVRTARRTARSGLKASLKRLGFELHYYTEDNKQTQVLWATKIGESDD